MIFDEAQSVLTALRQARASSGLLEGPREALKLLEENLNEALQSRDEARVRELVQSIDFFLAEQGEKMKTRILELLPKE